MTRPAIVPLALSGSSAYRVSVAYRFLGLDTSFATTATTNFRVVCHGSAAVQTGLHGGDGLAASNPIPRKNGYSHRKASAINLIGK